MSGLGNKSLITAASADLIDAKLEQRRMRAAKHCPSCGHIVDGKPDWVGLPAGVKFDPTDQELIEHLEAKVKDDDAGGRRAHPLIDEFIPTIGLEDGICYTHPEKLPGVTKNGLCKHFFHRPSKAYTTGTRKRRKIQTEGDDHQSNKGETRWHKTGKTRPVMVNGRQKGCKKILVLYTNFGKHRKPEKTNWVMHQYHLGEMEEEKEGELVVSKIFYQTQPRQCGWSDKGALTADTSAPSGSGSSKEVLSQRDDHLTAYAGAMDLPHHQHLKTDHFSFTPFRKTFDEVGIGELPPKAGDMHDDQKHQHHLRQAAAVVAVASSHHLAQEQQHAAAAAAAAAHSSGYLISRPGIPVSNIISPLHHHTSVVLDDPYRMPGVVDLQPDKFQQQHHHQQKLDQHRSTSGLEELIMGCTSSGTKGEASIPHSQETEWQYSYWQPDNPDHQG